MALPQHTLFDTEKRILRNRPTRCSSIKYLEIEAGKLSFLDEIVEYTFALYVEEIHPFLILIATASYRLLPEVTLTREIRGGQASILQSCFSPGVIGIDSDGKAFVKDARYDTCSRNVYRYEDIKDAVILSRVRNHFIFNVESVGAMPPNVIFVEAVKILRDKCKSLLDELNNF